jgi:hypothetical protein
MSQGELHSLALSLFLPRATLTESPFRFVVIDDPVQSMDPARVDGLARALEETARSRQVIVFTHDDRLPEAIRRMGIATTILMVTRRERSVVEVRKALDPVQAHIEDAFALAHTADLPLPVVRRLVPGFCRSALEAAFIRVIRRRRPAAGTPHAGLERHPMRAQLICLRHCLPEKPDLTPRVYYAWSGLSRACHQHAYELPPTSSELAGWIEAVEELAGVVTEVTRKAGTKGISG